ncbi:MAG: zinc ribbon domain-containing protein [Candidatus Heimdallarchaeota archaeon]
MSEERDPRSILPHASLSQIEKLLKTMARFQIPVTKDELSTALSKSISRVGAELAFACKLGLAERYNRTKFGLTSRGNDLVSLPKDSSRRPELLRLILVENFPHVTKEIVLQNQIADSKLLNLIRFARSKSLSEENARQYMKRLRSFLREGEVIGNRIKTNGVVKWEVHCTQCSKCNHLVLKEKKFCLHCGHSLIQQESAPISCSACGTPNPEFSKFCEDCGTSLALEN